MGKFPHFPNERAQVAELRFSLLKLAHLAEVSRPKKIAFQQIALKLNDVSCLYVKAKDRYDNAKHSLKRLRDLQS